MEQNKKKIISITDITAWLYCPRKLYITKVKGIKQPLTKEMLIGKMKHQTLEIFSKREREIILNMNQDYEKLDIVLMYEEFLKSIAEQILDENLRIVESFRINREEVIKKILKDFMEDIRIRVINIKSKLKLGLFREELWKNLDLVYLSELSLESENLGLRGRVDRIEISRVNNEIIPYELKTREEKIFPSDEIQLTAYAMLLEDHYKTKIKKGIVESGSLKKEIPITEENKNIVLKIADEIRNLKENIIPMMQSNFNKCKSCSFNEICQDI